MKRIVVAILFVSVLFIGNLFFSSCSDENIDANSKDSISISFFVDGEQYEIKKLNKIDNISFPDAPSKEGYSFDGWYIDNGIWNTPLIEGNLLGQNIVSDTTVYAKFTQIVYQINYNSNGGRHTNATTYTVETSVKLTAPEKVGFNFVGWYKDSDFTQKVTEITVGTVGDITLYAKYDDGTSYTISYEANGGEHDNPSSYTVTDSVKLNDAYKKGYTFLGWYTDNTYETKIDAINRGMYANLTLYAKFEPVSYTITYQDEKNRENSNPNAYTIESEIQLKPLYAGGYVFLGWFDGNKRVEKINEGSSGNMELTAKWAEINVDAIKNIELAGNISGLENGIAIGEEVTLSATTNSGYTWLGWFDGEQKVTSDGVYKFTNNGQVKCYTAKWAEYFVALDVNEGGTLYRGYAVSFDVNYDGGNPPATQYVNSLTPLSFPLISRDGYVLTGWYIDQGCTALFDWSSTITSDVHLYAGWQAVGDSEVVDSLQTKTYTFTDIEANWANWHSYYFCILDESELEIEFEYACLSAHNNNGKYALDFELWNVTKGIKIDNDIYIQRNDTHYYTKQLLDASNVEVGDVIRLRVKYDSQTPKKLLNKFSFTITRRTEIEYGYGNLACVDGHYTAGEEITLSVSTNPGYTWLGWFNGETKVSDDLTYTFVMPNNNVTLTPKWEPIN